MAKHYDRNLHMKKTKELPAEDVTRRFELKELGFKTTDELLPRIEFIGQERSYKAIEFGLGMEYGGYNLYLAGPPGVGKKSVINEILTRLAREKPTPPDWCYVFNMHDPN